LMRLVYWCDWWWMWLTWLTCDVLDVIDVIWSDWHDVMMWLIRYYDVIVCRVSLMRITFVSSSCFSNLPHLHPGRTTSMRLGIVLHAFKDVDNQALRVLIWLAKTVSSWQFTLRCRKRSLHRCQVLTPCRCCEARGYHANRKKWRGLCGVGDRVRGGCRETNRSEIGRHVRNASEIGHKCFRNAAEKHENFRWEREGVNRPLPSKKFRMGSESGQKWVRNGSEMCQKSVRNGSEMVS